MLRRLATAALVAVATIAPATVAPSLSAAHAVTSPMTVYVETGTPVSGSFAPDEIEKPASAPVIVQNATTHAVVFTARDALNNVVETRSADALSPARFTNLSTLDASYWITSDTTNTTPVKVTNTL